jgi:phospholipase C
MVKILRLVAVCLVVGAVFASAASAAVGTNEAAPSTRTPIKHVVVIVEENHSFDSYFANYCNARLDGQRHPVCSGGTTTAPGSEAEPLVLDDASNGAHDPNHSSGCEASEIDQGKMDGFLTAPANGGVCGAPYNFSYAASGPGSPVAYYDGLATAGALADHYFQPVVGASSSNDMYFWTTRFVFKDDDFEPDAIGKQCSTTQDVKSYDDTGSANANLGKLLTGDKVGWAWYAQGYAAMQGAGDSCPAPPAECPLPSKSVPCAFEPGDVPAEYYASSVDKPADMRDLSQLATDVSKGSLPSVAFVKPAWYDNEHPGLDVTLSQGVSLVRDTINTIERSKYGDNTLVLLTWDESGGYYDHMQPPATSAVDGQPYGARVPMIAVGKFARHGTVSHQVLEHSSITKFIEWNWLGKTGQLDGRDRTVHNLGSVLAGSLHVPT